MDGVTIQGAGATNTVIDAGGIDRVFEVRAGTTTISGVTVKGGETTVFSNGGGISNSGGALTLNNAIITTNTATGGGGVFNGGTLTLNNSTVTGNKAKRGGGIYSATDLVSKKTDIANSTLSTNTATEAGAESTTPRVSPSSNTAP